MSNVMPVLTILNNNITDMSQDMDDEEIPDLLDSAAEAGPSRVLDRPKIPLTLLTGYLGAGKSTLLEYVLTADHGYRIAVCMNDFGDTTDIEAKSLTLSDPTTQSQTTSFLSLPNGCLCCSFKDMGIAAIEEMVAAQATDGGGGVDWVMVELTGVADPGPIARSFWANEEMGDLILDGVVCVVDCRNVLKQLSEDPGSGQTNECQKQVACADVILLNKTDLVSPARVKEVEERIRQINPTLRVHHTIQSRIPLDSLFHLRAFADSAELTKSDVVDQSSHHSHGDDAGHHGHDHEHGHDHDHTHHADDITTRHNPQVSTVLIPLPPLTSEQYSLLNDFLETLLWEGKLPVPQSSSSQTQSSSQPQSQSDAQSHNHTVSQSPIMTTESVMNAQKPVGQSNQASVDQPDILRTKGFIPLLDGQAYILQGVTDMFELKPLPTSAGDSSGPTPPVVEEEVRGKVVFIGKGVGEGLKVALLHYLGIV